MEEDITCDCLRRPYHHEELVGMEPLSAHRMIYLVSTGDPIRLKIREGYPERGGRGNGIGIVLHPWCQLYNVHIDRNGIRSEFWATAVANRIETIRYRLCGATA